MNRTPMPQSLWAATAGPGPETPPLAGEAAADVVVVGGGFTGLSTALHAAERGANVILLEAEEPGFGASGRNGGQVIPGFKLDPDELVARFGSDRGERLIAFAGRAPDIVFGLIERHAIDCQASRNGWIQAAHAVSAVAAVETRVKQWQRRGAPVELADRSRMTSLTGARGYVGGMIDARGGLLNPLAYARGLARAAIKAGARICGASLVTGVRPEGRRWRVETPGGAVVADQVVLATNAYTGDLWPGLARSIIPVYSYQIATRPLTDNLRRSILPHGHAVSDTRRLLTYFRLDPHGRLVVGGRGAFHETSEPRFFRHVVAALHRLFPQIPDHDLDFYWSGKVALTTDHFPFLSELAPGVTAALGYNGRGVAMASAMGTVLADRVLGKPLDDLPVPARPIRPIPLHSLRRPVIRLLVGWKRLLDRLEMAS